MQLFADRVIEVSHEAERLNGKLRTEVADFKKKEKLRSKHREIW
jgi:hypothetical protein